MFWKTITVSLIVALLNVSPTFAASRIKSYTKKNGTYVQPSYRTAPNKTKLDNYSTKGNYNPYTGKKGYVSPYKTF